MYLVDLMSMEFNVLLSKVSAALETQSIECMLHSSKLRMLCGSRYETIATIRLPSIDNKVGAAIPIFATISVEKKAMKNSECLPNEKL